MTPLGKQNKKSSNREKQNNHSFDKIILKGIERAINLSKKCSPEDNRIHPKVGVVVIKDNKIFQEAYRGELKPGEHAEFTVLKKIGEKIDLTGATLITTLEPCIKRKHDKYPCAEHIVRSGIKEVVFGLIDPNHEIRGKGEIFLINHDVNIRRFPPTLLKRTLEINERYWKENSKMYKRIIMASPQETKSSLESTEKLKDELRIKKAEYKKYCALLDQCEGLLIDGRIDPYDDKFLEFRTAKAEIEEEIIRIEIKLKNLKSNEK